MIRYTVQGDAQALARTVPDPERIALAIHRRWTRDAQARLEEKVSGGPATRYLQARTGRTRKRIGTAFSYRGAELHLTGPAARIQEYGGEIRPKRGAYLTFRLMRDSDTGRATGAWVRARVINIRAKFMVRDAGDEASRELDTYLGEVIDADPR